MIFPLLLLIGDLATDFLSCFKKVFSRIIRIVIIRIDTMRIASYNMIERENTMPKRPREMEKEILDDGWIFKSQEGSHRHYVHPTKPGKVTIPFHSKELSKIVEKSIRKQAGLDK